MNAYIYRAALYCEECADKIRREIEQESGSSQQLLETGTDSEGYPQGPYLGGGGEADSPQHCDACGLFLENALTPDGDAYVREQAEPFTYPDDDGDVAPWALVAERADDAGQPALGDWIRYYFAPGL